jgi:hypothetical protein
MLKEDGRDEEQGAEDDTEDPHDLTIQKIPTIWRTCNIICMLTPRSLRSLFAYLGYPDNYSGSVLPNRRL